jgi:hypothetical protein
MIVAEAGRNLAWHARSFTGTQVKLDWFSSLLTVSSMIVVGRQLWWGWVLAAVNCFVLLYIAHESGLSGLIPANIICLAIYAKNTREWLKDDKSQHS